MISHGREAEHRNRLAIKRRGLVRAREWTLPKSFPGRVLRKRDWLERGLQRVNARKEAPPPDGLGPPFQISTFHTGGRSFHARAVVPRVLG